MPWHTIFPWARSPCCLPREHGTWSHLSLEPCLAPCSVMVMQHAGHASPHKEQLCALLVRTLLPRLWCCLALSLSKKQLCSSCFVLCQVGQLKESESAHAWPPIWVNRDICLICLMVCQLIEVTSPLYLACYSLHHCGYHDPPFKQIFSSAAGASRNCSLSSQPWRLRACVHAHKLLVAGIFLHCFLI